MRRGLSCKGGHYLIRLSIFVIMAALIAGMIGCDGYTPSKDLEIRTWYDLEAVQDNLAGHHVLMNDLDSSTAGYEIARSWQPIHGFRGTLDGQGHEIRDMFVKQPDYDRGGLFSLLYKGVLTNIGLVDANVIGKHYIGGLVGENDQGTISNCYCTGSITGDVSVGGLVGLNEGAVSSSYFSGSVTGDGYYVGGLVGENRKGTISNAHYNYDEVLINGENIITIGALLGDDFDEWLANGEYLDINARLSQEDGYYLVNNVTDCKQLLAFGQDNSLRFRLTSNLDLADEPNFYIPYLAGEFHGDGHEISNLSFNFSSVCQVGLFGYLASNGTVNEVSAANVSIGACECVGGLVGFSEGTVSNSHSTGNVTGSKWWIGGLVGFNLGTVSNSYFSGNVTGHYYVGGLAGYGSSVATVIDSYSSANVSGNHVVGGLVGESRGTTSNCSSSGSVSGFGSVGGLVGEDFGNIVDCHSTATVGADNNVGGLVGWNNGGTVSSCFSTGSVSGSEHVGGLVGRADDGGALSDCYSTGSVTGYSWVGGLVGWNEMGTVSNSYSTGSVTAEGNVGGLIGVKSNGTVRHSFWDTQTSGQATSDGGTGKTTAEMHDITTFSGASWNIVGVANPDARDPAYIWNIVDDVTYPFLSWQAV